jgi:transposase
LAPKPLARLPALLPRGPEAYGFRGQGWTRTRVAEVRRVECGVVDHPAHGGRLLKAIRWSPPKPLRRARQRAETAIARWRPAPWPALKKGRRRSNRRASC